jgi:hypothetical protein
MNFDLPIMGDVEIDWDQFLVDTDLANAPTTDAFASPSSPAVSDSQTATPKSTESEQSQALDPVGEDDFDVFNFEAGIMHNPEDILAGLPEYVSVPDQRGAADPTMTSTFGVDFGDFGAMTGLGNNAATQLGLIDLFQKLEPQPSPTIGADLSDALAQSYAALGWLTPAATSAATTVEPAHLVTSPRPSLKRKDSGNADEAAPTKRPRGRPPKPRADSGSSHSAAKRPYRRQSKSTSVSALAAAAVSGTPSFKSVSFADEEDSEAESESSPRLTASGKSSTARPKSVVPEKYFKDGSAQAIIGMTVEEIQAFPTYEELLKKVAPALRAGAAEFGERIKENRDKAKDAAKKSRDERRAKIDSLERTVAELEGKIEGMRGVMMALVSKGLLSEAEMRGFV